MDISEIYQEFGIKTPAESSTKILKHYIRSIRILQQKDSQDKETVQYIIKRFMEIITTVSIYPLHHEKRTIVEAYKTFITHKPLIEKYQNS